MTETEIREFDKAASEACKKAAAYYYEIYTIRSRPRKHVKSRVIEPKQIEGEKNE